MNSENAGLVIFGFGGHARSVADIALYLGYQSLLFVDENARDGETFLGFSVLKVLPENVPIHWLYMPAMGDNHKRMRQVEFIKLHQKPLATIIAPTATVGAGATVLPGSFIGHHAHIGPMAVIKEGCIVNTSAVIEHECVIGEYTHISVNTTVAGRSVIGHSCFIGAAATVIDSIQITSDVTVGAGAVVIKDIGIPGIYVGNPVRSLSK